MIGIQQNANCLFDQAIVLTAKFSRHKVVYVINEINHTNRKHSSIALVYLNFQRKFQLKAAFQAVPYNKMDNIGLGYIG